MSPSKQIPFGLSAAADEGSASHSQREGAPEALVVPRDGAGRRLDQWLGETSGIDLSRARAKALILGGFVRVNGAVVQTPKVALKSGDAVEVELPQAEQAAPLPQDIPLDILWEDESLIVVNKPAGLVVHPGAGNPAGTLVNALLFHCGESLSGIGGVKRPGIVHRLDANTSGVMVAAKTDRAHRVLSLAFADHGRSGDLERAYAAVVWGAPSQSAGTIDAPLGRDTRDPTKRAVVSASKPDARHAVTRFKVEERFVAQEGNASASLVECRLETGRTHQIRVHMAHLGHPLIGDPDYGAGFRTKANRLGEPARSAVHGFPRQALHARLLGFRHPATEKLMRFETALPPDMENLVSVLRRQD